MCPALYMENRGIDASLSTQSLTFRPGGPTVAFEVTVVNASDRFAAFQLEVLAAGANHNPQARWYRLSPEVSAAKPPGSSTQFQIVIFETPLPAFVGVVNLLVRIFSPQLREERKLVVRLTIEPGTRSNWLRVELPVQKFQVYPRNLVDIPVRVWNLNPQPADVVLRFTRLNPGWLVNSAERRLIVNPGVLAETTFQCQPPVATQAPSEIYDFTIEAHSQDGSKGSADGTLEVLPVGFVEFSTQPQQQTIPAQGGWLPDWKSNFASFQLLFKNASNLRQQVTVQVQGRSHRQCKWKVVPQNANLNLGETTKVLLETRVKRPWVGLAKILRLEAKALLSDQRLGSTDPTTQPLELRILPIVPLWLILLVLALVAALAFLLRTQPVAHTAAVNTVRFSAENLVVLSGSDDCTIRRWTIASDRLKPKEQLEEENPPQQSCNGKPLETKGLLAVTNQYVWSLQFLPGESNLVAAGLQNGDVELRNVATGKLEYRVSDAEGASQTDRVLDMALTQKALDLFSGHAGGKIRVWQRDEINKQFELTSSLKTNGPKYVIRALALSQDESTLLSAGGSNSLIVWDSSRWQQTESKLRPKRLLSGKLTKRRQEDEILDVAFLPNFPDKLFATADSDGFMTIWDLDKCVSQADAFGNPPLDYNRLDEPVTSQCQEVDRWQVSHKAVRSFDFSQDGLQLVTAGDDGRVVLWRLTSEGKLDHQAPVTSGQVYLSPEGYKAQQISPSNQNRKLNSIQLISDNRGGVMAVGGGENEQNGYFQVKLYPLP